MIRRVSKIIKVDKHEFEKLRDDAQDEHPTFVRPHPATVSNKKRIVSIALLTLVDAAIVDDDDDTVDNDAAEDADDATKMPPLLHSDATIKCVTRRRSPPDAARLC